MKHWVFVGVLCVLCCNPIFAQNEFVISFWCGPPAEFQTLERFKEIKDAGFTLAFPPCAGTTVEQNKKVLDLCQQVGLKALIMDGRMSYSIEGNAERKKALDAMVADYKDHPALFGYHIVDEPGPHAFGGLAEVMSYLKEKDPKHPGFINLLPVYAREHNILGGLTYEQYVWQYADVVKPPFISYDHYHFFGEGRGDRSSFFENLTTIRQVALEKKLPFWNIVLCTQHGWYRNLNEAELRFEAMQTLAFGGKGLLWFTYWFPAGVPKEEGWDHSMIRADGTRDPHYEMVKKINAEVKAIGDVLVNCESVHVSQMAETGVARMGEGLFTVGFFRAREGWRIALVTNRDYRKVVATTMTISSTPAKVERFDPTTQKWSEVVISDAAVALEIGAGDGVLLRW
jgi:hypothetical protein